MTARLVTCANELHVLVTNRILPDRPRPANAAFWANALSYLIGLEQAGIEHEPIPAYLATAGRTPHAALTQLIPILLTNFAADPARQVIILYSAAARRVAKLAMILDNRSRSLGELLHLVERAHGDELTFAQAVSSPERHLLLALDSVEIMATGEFVRRHTDGRKAFQQAAAQQELRELWAREIAMLRRVPNYHELARARYGDECHPTAACSVAYDCLGHDALCVLEPHGAWKTWTLEHHPDLVQGMAELGSGQARKMARRGDRHQAPSGIRRDPRQSVLLWRRGGSPGAPRGVWVPWAAIEIALRRWSTPIPSTRGFMHGDFVQTCSRRTLTKLGRRGTSRLALKTARKQARQSQSAECSCVIEAFVSIARLG